MNQFCSIDAVSNPYLFYVSNPILDVVEGLFIGDVVHQHNALITWLITLVCLDITDSCSITEMRGVRELTIAPL